LDPVKVIPTHLLDRLECIPQDKPVAVHGTCSTQPRGESRALIDLVGRCTREVVSPEGIHCCGFAGDKGFTTPELNAHSLRRLKDAVQFCEEGVSTSRTCEIGLSEHGGCQYSGDSCSIHLELLTSFNTSLFLVRCNRWILQ
ncbi:(Fe-S)-binding protein, partial [Pseudomonas aeruginosa]